MKTNFITRFFLIIFFSSYFLNAQYSVEKEIIEPLLPEYTWSEQTGGKMITSIAENGQYLRVLIKF